MSGLKTLKTPTQAVPQRPINAVDPSSWRTGKNSTQRGYGYKWQQARLAFLAKHPLCAYCERDGRVTEATVVDHIKPHRGDMRLFWDRSNWSPLCATCHSSVKQAEENQG